MSDNNQDCRHVAIIMDGNGRWATRNRLARAFGHRAGVKAVKKAVTGAIQNNLEVLTVYAFSTENWARPQEEVSFLMELFFNTLESELDELDQQNIRLSFIGAIDELPEKLQERLANAVEKTKNNNRLQLVVALNYGGRREIVEACRLIAKQVSDQTLALEEIDEKYFNRQLWLGDLPPVDLLIRTSGEQRLSNFLLWQLAYTELYFTDCHWPDFDEKEMKRALDEFAKRQRRYGGA